MEDKLLTASDVAGRWGVHRATVLRLFHAGVLPGIILCRGRGRTTVRFRLASVEAWERRRERTHSIPGK